MASGRPGDFVAFTDADGQFEIADLALLAPPRPCDLAAGWRRSGATPSPEVVSWVFNTWWRCSTASLPRRRLRPEADAPRVLDSLTLEARSALINAELYYKARYAGWRIARWRSPPPRWQAALVPVPRHRPGHQGAVPFRLRIRRSLRSGMLPPSGGRAGRPGLRHRRGRRSPTRRIDAPDRDQSTVILRIAGR